jgi:hypothetical protein
MAIAGIAQIALFRLIPPYSVHIQASALRPRTATLLEFVRGNLLTEVS